MSDKEEIQDSQEIVKPRGVIEYKTLESIISTNDVIIGTDGACVGSRNGKLNARASYACLAIKMSEFSDIVDKPLVDFCKCAKIVMDSTSTIIGATNVNGDIQTNNRGELMAILSALEYIKNNNIKTAFIISDSKYSIMSINVWYHNWIKHPKLLKGKLNLDLISSACNILDEIKNTSTVYFTHIHSHKKFAENTNIAYICWYMNFLADKYCQEVLN